MTQYDIIGAILEGVEKDNDGDLIISTSKGKFFYRPEYSCTCGETFIEHIEAPPLGGRILKNFSDEKISSKEDEEYEVFFIETLKTTKGDLDVELRITKSPYYGGYLSFYKWEEKNESD